MSDCISAGKAFEHAQKEMNSRCPKRKKHKWIDGPYGIKVCDYCGKLVYLK